MEIGADQLPYVASGTGIDATIPNWVFAGGVEAAADKVRDPELRARIKKDILDPDSDRGRL